VAERNERNQTTVLPVILGQDRKKNGNKQNNKFQKENKVLACGKKRRLLTLGGTGREVSLVIAMREAKKCY